MTHADPAKLSLDDAALGAIAFDHLQHVVAIDSASDEHSQTVPTTPGQTVLANALAAFFKGQGAQVERDDFANIIASLPARGAGIGKAPIALMVHLDTAPGTVAVDGLQLTRAWTGSAVHYPSNDRLCVDVATYPLTAGFVGQDLVHGPGDAPFGLDDKLGLTHLMTLARILNAHPEIEHPPLMLIGRPDEEVGRDAALIGLAALLAERGVTHGFTIDGLDAFEINVANFNAAHAALTFPERAEPSADGVAISVFLGGVNTHGATAHAEMHRSAVRFAAEITASGVAVPTAFQVVPDRHCDGTLTVRLPTEDAIAPFIERVESIVAPHVPRGAQVRFSEPSVDAGPIDMSVADALAFVRTFLADDAVSPLLPEDSKGTEGYSAPYRIEPGAPEGSDGGARLDIRIRDFTPAGIGLRKAQIARLAPFGVAVTLADQYRDMSPRLAPYPELLDWPKAAADRLGLPAPVQPIRGGTGVDPFLDQGVFVANLGTGYFAPESEKEFTSLQSMAGHARWLVELVRVIAAA
ncbi:MAG: di/tripeptidase [Bradymonadia bacterium]|jgi:di/tripeptidase